MLQFVGYARTIFPTMIKWYLTIALTPTSSWVGHTMCVALIEKQQLLSSGSSSFVKLRFTLYYQSAGKKRFGKHFFRNTCSCRKIYILDNLSIYKNLHGQKWKNQENLRIIDSYRFMLAPLAKLVDNLPNETFFLLENYFEKLGHSPEKVSMLKHKGHYPYSYFNSFEKLRETRLPPRAMWKISLLGGDVSVSRSEYNHALKVFTELKCGSLGDYHDLYLTTDVLLLDSVSEAFCEVCYQTNGLDCA